MLGLPYNIGGISGQCESAVLRSRCTKWPMAPPGSSSCPATLGVLPAPVPADTVDSFASLQALASMWIGWTGWSLSRLGSKYISCQAAQPWAIWVPPPTMAQSSAVPKLLPPWWLLSICTSNAGSELCGMRPRQAPSPALLPTSSAPPPSRPPPSASGSPPTPPTRAPPASSAHGERWEVQESVAAVGAH